MGIFERFSRERPPTGPDKQDLRVQRYRVSQEIIRLEDDILRLAAYRDAPPAETAEPLHAMNSAQHFVLSHEDRVAFKLPDTDPRKQAVMNKINRQSDQQMTVVNAALEAQRQTRVQEYVQSLPEIPQELMQLHIRLEELYKQRDLIQFQMDAMR
jgi:hypothetical protein